MQLKSFSTVQKLALIYGLSFFFIVLLGYIPAFNGPDRMLFGLFHIQLIDDALHVASGIWALFGAFRSKAAALFYFRWFGLYYTADAFVGFFTGYTILDLLMFNFGANAGFSINHFSHNIAVNLPHFIIGPSALLIGYKLYKKFESKK